MEIIDSIKTIQLFENNHESSIVAPPWRNALAENIQDPLVLGCVLHQELDWEDVLKKFAMYLKKMASYDLISYFNPEKNFSWQCGEPASYRITYRLQVNDQFLGHLLFARRHPFSDLELFQMESLLTVLIFPLRNALQYQFAMDAALYDPLTQLLNRKAFDRDLKQNMGFACRHQQPLTLMVMDIDHFKKFNDQNGHAVGDQILLGVSHAIQNVIRQTDQAYRYGGEEFAILLQQTDLAGAALLADRIRDQIKQSLVFCGEKVLSVTASIGIALLKPTDDRHSFFQRADEALYKAKHGGRNQVVSETSKSF